MRRVTILAICLILCLLSGCAGRRVFTVFSQKVAAGDVATYEKGKAAAAQIRSVWPYHSKLIKQIIGKNYEDEMPSRFRTAVSTLDALCAKEGDLMKDDEGTIVGAYAVVNWTWAEWVKDKYGSTVTDYLKTYTGIALPF